MLSNQVYKFFLLSAFVFSTTCKPRTFNNAAASTDQSAIAKLQSPWPTDVAAMKPEQIQAIVGDTGRCPGKKEDPLYQAFQKIYAEYVKFELLNKVNKPGVKASISPGAFVEHGKVSYQVIMTLGEGTRGISLWVRDARGLGQPFVLKLMKMGTDTTLDKEAWHYKLNHKAVLPAVFLSQGKAFPYSGLVKYLDLDEKTKLVEAPLAEGTLRLEAIKGISTLFVTYLQEFIDRKGRYAGVPRFSQVTEERAIAFMQSIFRYMGASDIVENFVLDVDCLSIAKIDPG